MPYASREHGPRTRRVLDRIGRTTMLARVGQGQSQRGLGALTSIDQSTISRLENGSAAGLRLDKLAAIIAVLDLDRFDQLRPPAPTRPTRE
ncbi:MAG TPA: helix-turn-helix transcriptional regulator [Candidatus Limnocylindrales bacterium]